MNEKTHVEGQSLADIPAGGKVYVTSVKGTGAIRGRIMAMGLVPGTAIEVVRRAPLGDPLELMVKGYNLSLRATEAGLIAVSFAPPTPHDVPGKMMRGEGP